MTRPSSARRWFAGGTLDLQPGVAAARRSGPPRRRTTPGWRMDWIIGAKMGHWFWCGGIGVGHVLPLVLLATRDRARVAFAACWRWRDVGDRMALGLAPQQVPLS